MPSRKTLGSNIDPPPGGMMAAFGFAAPQPATPATAAIPFEDIPPSPPPERETAARRSTPSPPDSAPSSSPEASPPGRSARIPTDISAAMLALARSAAYWNRETLRAFIERAIKTEANRIAEALKHDILPPAPPLKKGRPLKP
jgi:hypothetical protein